jgi:hypothetical protein
MSLAGSNTDKSARLIRPRPLVSCYRSSGRRPRRRPPRCWGSAGLRRPCEFNAYGPSLGISGDLRRQDLAEQRAERARIRLRDVLEVVGAADLIKGR